MDRTIIEIEGLAKSFGSSQVVKDLNLEIHEGEFLTLLGPSGCGKTTLLRMIGGFETPDRGSIRLRGKDLIGVPPSQRDVNTVFQGYALFPHMDVRQNVGYGLKVKKVDPAEIERRVEEVLALTQLEAFARRKPKQLSGGQQQRVAIARGIVNAPGVLLLDEPLGALDLKLRRQMQVELKRLQRKLRMTYVYVTHDREEALTMSDRVAVMDKGRIVQIGAPAELYDCPRNAFVADFIGETNILRGKADGAGNFEFEGRRLALPQGVRAVRGQEVALSLRPERLILGRADEGADGGADGLRAKVLESSFSGSTVRRVLALESGRRMIALGKASGDDWLCDGGEVFASWKSELAVWLAGEKLEEA